VRDSGKASDRSAAPAGGACIRSRLRELVCCPDCAGPCHGGPSAAPPGPVPAAVDSLKAKPAPSSSPQNVVPEPAPLPSPPRNVLPKPAALQSPPAHAQADRAPRAEKGAGPVCPADDYRRLTRRALSLPERGGSLLR
jgi:hypothetical protein